MPYPTCDTQDFIYDCSEFLKNRFKFVRGDVKEFFDNFFPFVEIKRVR
jgi:hypothetical protein